MPIALDGPRLPARSGRATSLLVFLHGYGADGNDLIDIGRLWQSALPDTAFASPHAPEPCAEAPVGRQWFALSRTSVDPVGHGADLRWQGATRAAPVLNAFLDAELARLGLAPGRLMLVGFSQGAMMALHVGLQRRPPPAAILAYSGALIGPEHLAGEIADPPPPVLLVHGDADPVVPFEALAAAREGLAAAGVPCQWHVSPGLGHGIDEASLLHGARFLAAASTGSGARTAGPSQD
ncbi:MAG TPA: dienelactone hydrolase family protein [Hyphomicrobiales bacterium]|nr:dienelactone hydrolase family protein [Hyphomicrobiales bacterium]